MTAALPTSTAVEPFRSVPAARVGGARSSEASFSGQLAQALAAPAPGGAAPSQDLEAQLVAEPGEPPPAPMVSPTAGPVLAASATLPETGIAAPEQPPGDAGGQEAVAAAQPDGTEPAETKPAEAARDPDELAMDTIEAEILPGDPATVPLPMLQSAMVRDGLALAAAPEPSTSDARPDALPTPAPTADGLAADAAPEAEPFDSAPEKVDVELKPPSPDIAMSRADPVQAVSPGPTPSVAPNPADAAHLSAMQPQTPTHAARPVAPPDVAPASPPAPAAQVAPAVAALASTSTQDGVQRIVVRLNPIELGQVEVRIERADGGPASIALTVERPETLLLLLRDQAGLHRALDQAGVPAEGRTVQLQLGQQDPGTPGHQPDLHAGGSWSAGGGWGGFGGQGARHGRGETNRGWRHPADGEADPGARTAWGRAGIDITA